MKRRRSPIAGQVQAIEVEPLADPQAQCDFKPSVPSVFSRPPMRYSRPSRLRNQCSPFNTKAGWDTEAEGGGTEATEVFSFSRLRKVPLPSWRAVVAGTSNTVGETGSAALALKKKERRVVCEDVEAARGHCHSA